MKDLLYFLCLLLFVGIIMLDPTGKLLHLKEIAFVGIVVLSFLFSKVKIVKETMFSYSFLVIIAILSVCLGSIFFNSNLKGTVSYFKALMFGLVFVTTSKLSVRDIIKVNYISGLGLSAFISIMLLAFVGGFFDLSDIIEKMRDTETVMVARRDLFGISIVMFFYKTMPFLFFALIYALRNKKIISVVILLMPIIYGGSRTPMLMVLTIILYLLYDRKSKFFRTAIGLTGLIGIIYIVYLLTSSEFIQGGDEMKAGIASYLIDHSSILGHGVGTTYWDSERGRMTTSTELTYLEMLYQYGWLMFPFVLFIFFRPFFMMYRIKKDVDLRDYSIAYILYLVNAGTNPLLISSTGMWVFACALTLAAKTNEEKYLVEFNNPRC